MSDVFSEQAVVGCLIRHGSDAYFSVCDMLNTETFEDEICSALYHTVSELYEENLESLDSQIIYSRIKSKSLDSIVDQNDIKELSGSGCTTKSLPFLASKIRKLQIIKMIQRQLKERYNKGSDFTGEEDINQILNLVEIDFTELMSESKKIDRLGDVVEEIIRKVAENPVDQIGISSGLSIYDAAIGGGLRGGSVNLFGARMKVGKSHLSNNIGIHVAEQGIPVLYIDTEMRTEEQVYRSIARYSKVKIGKIETGKFTESEHQSAKVYEAVRQFKELPYYHVNVAGMAFEEHMGMMTRWIRKHAKQNPDGSWGKFMIIYDYLKMTSSQGISDNLAEHQILGFMITTLHNLMIRYDSPMVALVQLNRDGIKNETTDVVAGSDKILCLCTSFSILKDKSREEIQKDGETNGNKKLIVMMARHGAGLEDGDYINIAMDGSIGTIREINTRSQVYAQRQET